MASSRCPGPAARHPHIKARNSYVDETLFGAHRPCGSPNSAGSCAAASPTKHAALGKAGGAGSPHCSPAAREAVTIGTAHSPTKPGSVVLSKSQLDRMLQSAGPTPAELEQRRVEAQARLEQELAEAKAARAAREAAASAPDPCLPKSEMERLREKDRLEVVSRAQLALLEGKEEVRLMNQMIQFSKCAAARDQQVAAKAAAKVAARQEEARVVEEMEQRRRAGQEEMQERERLRALEQKRGALTILDQLAERERERAAGEQQRRLEGEDMKRRIRELREEEQQHEEERRVAARALLEEVARGNAELAARKRLQKQAEAEEAAQIAEYIRQRDAREQEVADERERVARAKELEVARMRAAQEKILDSRSAQDEARAKRYQDELELGQRRQAAAERQRREAMQRELEASRVEQLARKQAQRQEARQLEQAEFERHLAVKRQKDEADTEEEIARLEARRRHQQRVLAQVDARREVRSQEREELVVEGRRIRERLAEERALLEAVKQLKLRELEACGVAHKYHAQLARLQLGRPKPAS